MSKGGKYLSMVQMGVLATLVFVALPVDVFAAGETKNLNELFQNVADKQLTSLPYILSVVCYVMGAFLLVSGALSLKKHAENPAGGEPMGKGIARLVTGGAITSVPALTGIIQNSTEMKDGAEATFQNFKELSFK